MSDYAELVAWLRAAAKEYVLHQSHIWPNTLEWKAAAALETAAVHIAKLEAAAQWKSPSDYDELFNRLRGAIAAAEQYGDDIGPDPVLYADCVTALEALEVRIVKLSQAVHAASVILGADESLSYNITVAKARRILYEVEMTDAAVGLGDKKL